MLQGIGFPSGTAGSTVNPRAARDFFRGKGRLARVGEVFRKRLVSTTHRALIESIQLSIDAADSLDSTALK